MRTSTLHFPIFANTLLTDRNRVDLDWKSTIFKWRYRNKLTLERTFAIHGYHLIPYVAAELRRTFTRVVCYRWVNTSNSTPITSSKTTPEKRQTANNIM